MQVDSTGFEKQILGAIKGNQTLIDDYNITEKIFLNNLNKNFFNVMKAIHLEGVKIDSVLVFDRVQNTELASNFSYYEGLETFYKSNAKFYIEQQQELVKLRELRLLRLYISDWLKAKSTSEEIINLIDQKITKLLTDDDNSLILIKDCLYEAIQEIEDNYNLGGNIKGIKTGFRGLDLKLNGLNDGFFYILGARPSIGKTALALNIMSNIAKEGIAEGMLSCETGNKMLTNRIIAAEAQINSVAVRSGNLKAADFHNLNEAASRINEYKIWFDDKPNMTLSHIKTQSRRMVRRGVKIIFLDYIGLVKNENQSIPRWEQIAEISRCCKGLARELNVPFVALAQLKRETEGKRPTLADLRETGDLEADADTIIFLHREREKQETEIIVAKNRDGATGIVPAYFRPETLTFYERQSEIN